MWNRAALAKRIDHTVLRPDCTLDEVLRACDEAVAHEFASVVVFPCWVPHAARRLDRTSVRVGTVVGFPLGANSTRVKAVEVQSAVASGAQEIEAVVNVSALKSGDAARVHRDIEEVLSAAYAASLADGQEETRTRFVLETYYLTEQEIRAVAGLICEIGGDFLVTSTGFWPVGGTAEAVRLLRAAAGNRIGIKAVGGIHSARTAVNLLDAGASRIGTAAGIHILEEYLHASALEAREGGNAEELTSECARLQYGGGRAASHQPGRARQDPHALHTGPRQAERRGQGGAQTTE